MGEVYKARNTRLDRTVAVTILPTPALALQTGNTSPWLGTSVNGG